MIPERVIWNIREAQARYQPQRVVIRRWVPIGGGERGSQIVAEDVPARFTPGFGTWTNVADRHQGITPYRVSLPWDTDVLPGDEIVDEQSRTFHVRDMRKPETYQTAVQVLADLVTD